MKYFILCLILEDLSIRTRLKTRLFKIIDLQPETYKLYLRRDIKYFPNYGSYF